MCCETVDQMHAYGRFHEHLARGLATRSVCLSHTAENDSPNERVHASAHADELRGALETHLGDVSQQHTRLGDEVPPRLHADLKAPTQVSEAHMQARHGRATRLTSTSTPTEDFTACCMRAFRAHKTKHQCIIPMRVQRHDCATSTLHAPPLSPTPPFAPHMSSPRLFNVNSDMHQNSITHGSPVRTARPADTLPRSRGERPSLSTTPSPPPTSTHFTSGNAREPDPQGTRPCVPQTDTAIHKECKYTVGVVECCYHCGAVSMCRHVMYSQRGRCMQEWAVGWRGELKKGITMGSNHRTR